MKIILRLILPVLFTFSSARAGAFEFKDGDRVVLLGGTIIEREQKFGYFETQLALALGAKKISVRNLGWSGDTVFGTARSYFGPPAEGIERLTKHLEMLKPTVLISCYGADLAFDGVAKIPAFITGYGSLLDHARAKCPSLRITIIAPPPLENLAPPLPDFMQANANLASVRDALVDFAAKQNAHFVDGFDLMGGARQERPAQPLTDNGLHYSEAGYKIWTSMLIEGLGLKRQDVVSAGTVALRQAVIRKDFLFFNRWRPANETYLFGFRKREQEKNGAEMEQFDPLVDEAEKKIAQLKADALAVKKLP